LSKIRDVERYDDGQPKRKNGDWKYKRGNNEYIFVKRIPVEDAKTELTAKGQKPPGYIVDPNIRDIIAKARVNKIVPKDTQGNEIKRVKTITKSGRIVKERVNYRSKSAHKNFYYASAGAIPYAIMLERVIEVKGGKVVERKMTPIAIHEVAKTFKKYRKFNADIYLDFFHNGLKEKYDNWKLLRVGQKILVLKNDNELEEVTDVNFQRNRLFKITQFYDDGEGGVYLKYHLEATKDDDIDKLVKMKKDNILKYFDRKYNLPEIKEDNSLLDVKVRKKDYKDRKYKFVGLKDYRFKRLVPFLGEEEVKKIFLETKKYSKQSSTIKKEGETPLLKIGIKDCNFILEGEHFEMDILGNLEVFVDKLKS